MNISPEMKMMIAYQNLTPMTRFAIYQEVKKNAGKKVSMKKLTRLCIDYFKNNIYNA